MALWTGFPAGTGNMKLSNINDMSKMNLNIEEMPKVSLKCLARSSDFERKLGTRFVLQDSEKLLASAAENLDSLLLNLPLEVLLVIFSSFDHVAGQIALALTCKKLALVARDVDLTLSLTSKKYAGFLPIEVFDVPLLMHSLRPWMPSHLRLCNHCLTYRPSSRSYYDGISGCEISNFWIQKTGWEFSNGCWHKLVHDICPACHVSCTFSDYVDCDGCRALGRLGNVDWSRVTDHWIRRDVEEELRSGSYAT